MLIQDGKGGASINTPKIKAGYAVSGQRFVWYVQIDRKQLKRGNVATAQHAEETIVATIVALTRKSK